MPGVHLCRIVVDGEAAGKKNTQRVTFPKLYALGLKHGGERVNSPKLLLRMIADTARVDGARAAQLATMAEEALSPRLQPSSDFTRWKKRALAAIGNALIARQLPLLPEGNLGSCRVVVYMAAGQTGDLINFEQAVWDVLQDAQVIPSDYWLNGHDASERRWDDPLRPRVEIDVYDIGPRPGAVPEVRVVGFTAAREKLGPLTFHVKGPDGTTVRDLTAPRDISRDRLAMEAARIWRERFDGPLPAGSMVLVGNAPATQLALVP